MGKVIELIQRMYNNTKETVKDVFRTVSELGLYKNAWVSKTNDNNIVIGLNQVLSDSEFDKLVATFKDTDTSLKRANLDDKQTQRAIDNMEEIEDMLFISKPSSIDDLLNC
jgi:hypothetical protein